jgi:hypothetical protein
MDHFKNPRNVGEIENPDGVGEVGNPLCGDMMTIFLKIEEDTIKDIKFKTFGCGAAIAVSSMLTEMAKGKTLAEAKKSPTNPWRRPWKDYLKINSIAPIWEPMPCIWPSRITKTKKRGSYAPNPKGKKNTNMTMKKAGNAIVPIAAKKSPKRTCSVSDAVRC